MAGKLKPQELIDGLEARGAQLERERVAAFLDSKGICMHKLQVCFNDGNCISCWSKYLEGVDE